MRLRPRVLLRDDACGRRQGIHFMRLCLVSGMADNNCKT